MGCFLFQRFSRVLRFLFMNVYYVHENNQKTINNEKREEFSLSQTEQTNLEAHLPDDSEKLVQRSRVFSTVLYLVRTKNIKRARVAFLQSLKKKKEEQTSLCTMSQHGLGTWEGSLIIKEGPAGASQGGGHLIFIFNLDFFFLRKQQFYSCGLFFFFFEVYLIYQCCVDFCCTAK